MAELNIREAREKLPGLIEEFVNQHKKLDVLVETVQDMAKQLNIPTVTKDSNTLVENVEKVKAFVAKLVGEEGDLVTDTTSFWAVYSAIVKIDKATGGED